MRVWSEPYDSFKHRNPMNSNGWGAPAPADLVRHRRAPTLSPHRVVFVSVCGFTFEFHGREQVEACLDYYSQKIHPSTRLPANTSMYGDHEETQRWSDRLPLYLREESKRVRVVKALQTTLDRWEQFASSVG